jgi:multicomponent Na+:H+ antiporter subunit F
MAMALDWTMPQFLLAACGFVMVIVAVGLIRILRGPTDVDRMMAAQLFASGGVATLLLLAAGAGAPAALDVALTLALLTAFASVAFVKSASHASDDFESGEDQ